MFARQYSTRDIMHIHCNLIYILGIMDSINKVLHTASHLNESHSLFSPKNKVHTSPMHLYFPFSDIVFISSGPGSSVSIVTNYGLDGPGSNPGGDEISRPSRPALGSTQPPVKWVPGLSWGKVQPRRAADHSPPSSAAVMEA